MQDQRKVSDNLTLNHKRVLYVLEDTVESRKLRGHMVTLHEDADGKLRIRHEGRVLWHRAHARDEARISQGAIVENKRLGAALGWIVEGQRVRDGRHRSHERT